jgi:hypothetical protein
MIPSSISPLPSAAHPRMRSTAAYCSSVAFIKRNSSFVGIAARIAFSHPVRSTHPALFPLCKTLNVA